MPLVSGPQAWSRHLASRVTTGTRAADEPRSPEPPPALADPLHPPRAGAPHAPGASWSASSSATSARRPAALYTASATPRPRMKFAANLPVGLELRGEVLEVVLRRARADRSGSRRLRSCFPRASRSGREARCGTASRPRRPRSAAPSTRSSPAARRRALTCDALRGAVVRLLAAEEAQGKRRRGESERRGDAGQRDLRPLHRGCGGARGETRRPQRPGCGWCCSSTQGRRPARGRGARAGPAALAGSAVRTRLLFVDTPPIAR